MRFYSNSFVSSERVNRTADVQASLTPRTTVELSSFRPLETLTFFRESRGTGGPEVSKHGAIGAAIFVTETGVDVFNPQGPPAILSREREREERIGVTCHRG